MNPPKHGEWCRELSHPDPEQRDGPAWRDRQDDRRGDSVDDTDVAFARIVAGLRAEKVPAQDSSAQSDEAGWVACDSEADPGEDHFDPPEPPPLPMPRVRTVGGVLTLAVGILLLAAPNVLALGERVTTPLGLLAVTAGIGWLMIGLRPDPSADEPDDGARL
jgi:hypothetical protein